jgi:fructose-specific phosphotransferase system IIC component
VRRLVRLVLVTMVVVAASAAAVSASHDASRRPSPARVSPVAPAAALSFVSTDNDRVVAWLAPGVVAAFGVLILVLAAYGAPSLRGRPVPPAHSRGPPLVVA